MFMSLQTVIAIYVALIVFESFPLWMMVCGLLNQGSHLLVLKSFPFVDITSPSFVAGIGSYLSDIIKSAQTGMQNSNSYHNIAD